MCLHAFFKFRCFISRLFSAGMAVLPVLIIFLLGSINIANGQQAVPQIEYLPPPVLGEYRSLKDGDWNNPTTWQEWTGTLWRSSSTFPSEMSRLTPVVADWNTSTKTDVETKHTINLPPNIEAGDLILIFWTSARDGGGIVNLPSRFTPIYSTNSNNRSRIAWFKVATGSEGQTIDITAGTGASAHTSYRIAAGTYNGVPKSGTIATGRNSSPDPPALISGFGAVPTLWIASSHSDGNVSTPLDLPSLIAAYTGIDGDGGARTATTHLITNNSVSYDPKTFGPDVNSNWAANTIAIQGASQKAVIQNEHTVTVINNVTTSDVDVYGILHVNTNTAMTIHNNSALNVNNGGRLRLPGNNIAADDARIAGDGHFILNAGAYLEIGSRYGITLRGTTASYGNVRNSNSGTRIFNAGAHYIYNRTGLVVKDQVLGEGFPDRLTGSLTIDNQGIVGITSSHMTISSGASLNLIQGVFATTIGNINHRLTMGSDNKIPATINRSEGEITGSLLGSNWYQVHYLGDTKTAGAELSGTGLRNVIIDLADKTQVLTMNSSATVPGILALTTGVVNTSSSTLTMSSSSTSAISGGSPDSFVQGNLARGVAPGANTYNFPLAVMVIMRQLTLLLHQTVSTEM